MMGLFDDSNTMISLRIPKKMKKELKKRAMEEFTSTSSIIKKAINEYLKKE